MLIHLYKHTKINPQDTTQRQFTNNDKHYLISTRA